MIGQTVSHYKITAKIGEGGMGEVYRATDTKLNREVALKVLPQAFAQDEQRMERFEREAQLLASLNHPNIAAIYGLEEDKGTKALAMELVSGEDLSERISRGAAAWSPDGRWIVTGGFEAGVQGLFKIPVGGDSPEQIVEGEALNPVWSPDGNLIVYTGAQVNVVSPLLAVRPNGDRVELPKIEVFRFGQRARFLPDGTGLVTMRGKGPSQDFWLLDLATMKDRRLTQLDAATTMRTFDITPNGQQIVFDRLSEDSDIVLIELEPLR